MIGDVGPVSSSWRTFQTCDNRFPDFDMRHPTSLVSMGVVLTCDVMRQDSRVPTWWSRFLSGFLVACDVMRQDRRVLTRLCVPKVSLRSLVTCDVVRPDSGLSTNVCVYSQVAFLKL